MSYRIKTVVELTGIPKNTLFAWERRYGLVRPARQENGYRMYSDQDVAFLKEVQRWVAQGRAVSEAIALVRSASSGSPATSLAPDALDLDKQRDRLWTALLAFDREQAERVVAELGPHRFQELLECVYTPLLHDVGEGWAEGRVTVVQEHFVSAFCREQLMGMLLRVGCGPTNGPWAVCAGFPDDDHDLGLLAVAIRLALAGWRVTFLGANVPIDPLAGFLQARPVRLLCISVSYVEDPKRLHRVLKDLRRRVDPSVALVVGGAAVGKELRLAGVQVWDGTSALAAA